jgi:hypothetical protein
MTPMRESRRVDAFRELRLAFYVGPYVAKRNHLRQRLRQHSWRCPPSKRTAVALVGQELPLEPSPPRCT